ncbi:hypothetical protein PC119_g7 [Phytophthora cactorum]|nr:hypothetical protein PC119_g7 [Phytophthora cactorum]
MLRRALVAALTAQTVQISLAATIYKISASYLGDQCDGTPYAVYASTSTDCTATGCSPGSSNINADMQTIDCSTDYIQAIRDKFGSSPYLIKQMNVDETCSTLSMAFGYPASGTCVGAYDRSYYVVASLNKNGSASVKSYNERSCLSSDLYQIDSANKTTLEQHLCDAKAYSWYSSNDVESSNSGSNETSAKKETLQSSGRAMVDSVLLQKATRDKFGSSPYIIELVYGDENCSYFGMGYGYPASGTCVGGYTANDSYYVIASLHKDGSASLELFPDRSCLSESIYSAESGDKEAVETHECDANWFRWYSSNDVLDASGSALTSGSSGDVSSAALSNGDILGIVLGSFVFLMVFLVAVFLRQRQKAKANESTIHSLSAVSAASLEATIRGQTGLWNDDIITTKRIPRDKGTKWIGY